ncbi:unnamed protein product [Medioppia subpectinata]|uniref:Uncharacterized protein n=1 Tax=Medioppia subpectinata TaxID=1979941 RepID=A0A7R9LEN9_9ACAR|nr:unnamed protein product [Medioppia subpectinata]CAG2118209.1 unnamed protein product [Medioppia subpectinata]
MLTSTARMHGLTRLWSPAAAMGVRCASTTSGQKFSGKNIVLIDGVRTPFNHSNTDYKDLMAYELQTKAILLVQTI